MDNMDKKYFFERNLLALSGHNPALCSRLSVAETTLGRYKFLDAFSGGQIPALVDRSGGAHPLHSTIDPVREAQRLVSTLQDKKGVCAGNFVVFLGLGGGFAPLAALESGGASGALIIDYDINGIAELFSSREYITLLRDPRCTLLVDPSPGLIEETILELYRPSLCGGIRVMPLRPRVELDKQNFGAAGEAIQKTIEKVSQDYSVQAYFGMRWFANIIRNLGPAQMQNRSIPPIRDAAICAAGPSLDAQISLLARQKDSAQDLFVIAADTALPALLYRGLKPDAVVSIDCQHISYYHFMGTQCVDLPLFLDIASPPMLPDFSDYPFFFSGGHPLAAYVSQQWRPLPLLDTSGGNVSYACLSLAESLGARRITVYGADFSYPNGRVYAKGTYIYPFFERRQTRLSPLESRLSSFLYRSPFLPPEAETPCVATPGPYETAALRYYRKSFERKASGMAARQIAVAQAAGGLGIPLVIQREDAEGYRSPSDSGRRIFNLFAPGKMTMPADQFLEQYRSDIAALPVLDADAAGSTALGTAALGTAALGTAASGSMYLQNLGVEQRRVFATMLPQTAAVKHRFPELTTPELIETVKESCVGEIERVLNSPRLL